MEVKNVEETADRDCKCGTWIDHWERGAAMKAVYCMRNGCLRPAKVGAHVVKAEGDDRSQYIVPLCFTCNNETGAFTLKTDAALVSANKQKSCEA